MDCNHPTDKKVLIVEGSSDKYRVKKVIREEMDIICTHGTFGVEKFDHMLDKYDLDHREVYIFVDADEAGEKLRKQLQQELPHAHHLHIPTEWVEVERTPEDIIATELMKFHIDIDPIYLI